MSQQRIAIAMSGGIDSSSCAAILREQGQDNLFGITMILPKYADGKRDEESELQVAGDAERICNALGIDHFSVDIRASFETQVIDYFCRTYIQGRTPNPCVVCNPLLKFGEFMDAALDRGAEKMATGHYAVIEYSESVDRFQLKVPRDVRRDQTYFLYRLSQEQLSKVLFPLGHTRKKHNRRIAAGLGVDDPWGGGSRDICFLARGCYRDFIAQRLPGVVVPGDVVDTSGKKIGHHNGIIDYTIGKRKGLDVDVNYPVYVTRINAESNTIVAGSREECTRSSISVRDTVWTSVVKPEAEFRAEVKLRFLSPAAAATIVPGAGSVEIHFDEPQFAPTPGQSAVFYLDDIVAGGGFISEINK